MKKLVINILILVVIVGITFGATRHYFPKTVDNTVTDTLVKNVPYKVTEIKEVEKEVPVQIVKWKTDTVKVESVKVEKDTVYISTPSETFGYHSSFLTNYTYTPRFLNLAVTQDGVSFTGLWPDGTTETKTYQPTPYFKLGYSDGDVAFQKLTSPQDRLSHSIGAGYFQSFQSGYPYAKYKAQYRFFGVNLTGQAYLTEQPFGTIGVEYELGR